MIEISNRHFAILIEKLPRVLKLAQRGITSQNLRQQEDIRQLLLLQKQLYNKSLIIKKHQSL